MTISNFLQEVADSHGGEILKGANVLLSLDRPVDNLIRKALALGPYHPGKESAISHCFVLAEDYRGPDTAILDCTIRDDAGRIEWGGDPVEVIRRGLGNNGGIYLARSGDYDDPRITPVGVKYIPDLTAQQRQAVVDAGNALRATTPPYHYDLPGLLRELVALVSGVHLPAGPRLMFCSAFNEACYRNALGEDFSFVPPAVASADATPDDLWYSSLGVASAAPGAVIPRNVRRS